MSDDSQQVRVLFLRLAELPPADRQAELERACGPDIDLRRRVQALLQAYDQSGSDLHQPAGPLDSEADSHASKSQTAVTGEYMPSPSEGDDDSQMAHPATSEPQHGLAVGTVIAHRYTLRQQLGEGGMGEVWIANQSEPVKRNVAIKLIKIGMDSRAVLQRFEQERQALALMDHPNIARVLDGGLTDSGRPFFVMELVNGLPLMQYCDDNKLMPEARLQLFVLICQAVQHAHQKGIVHRDLKPANILVTLIDGRPVPKVIDFGVAKATAGRLTEETLTTQLGAVVGTLEYNCAVK